MTGATPRTGADNGRWVHPWGSRTDRAWGACLPSGTAEWRHTSLRVAVLGPGQEVGHRLEGEEAVVVPLVGGCTVGLDHGDRIELAGRPAVFAGPTDVAYVPAGRTVTLANHSAAETRVALCGAWVADPTGGGRMPRRLPAEEVPVELRGAGSCSREVRNFGVPDVLDAEQVIACEVLTPAGGWSSYPPHKHDTHRPGVEAELEEIYYFEVRATADETTGAPPLPRGTPRPDGLQPVGYQQVYGTDERPIDVLAEVATGDVVLVPHGWHGPAVAAPDADLYYLNVMAGPGPDRAWLICDDPAHTAVRDTWAGQAVHPRLPFGGTR